MIRKREWNLHTRRRLALLLALSSIGLAEAADVEAIEAPVEEVTLSLEDAEVPEEAEPPLSDSADLEPMPELIEAAEIELSPEEAVAREQSAQLDGLRSPSWVRSTRAVLTVEPVSDAAIVAASRDALWLGDDATHKLYRVALVNAAGGGTALRWHAARGGACAV